MKNLLPRLDPGIYSALMAVLLCDSPPEATGGTVAAVDAAQKRGVKLSSRLITVAQEVQTVSVP